MPRSPAVTYESLVRDLRALGVPEGRHVLVHCSMRRIGRVEGGPETLLRALRTVIGASAAVVVPAQTAHLSTTSTHYLTATAGMTEAERIAYESGMPGFDPARTPSNGMGALAEHVRRHPAATRSGHPHASFAAVGASAGELMRVHDLDSHLGERSPLAALYRASATTLLLGVGPDRCTALHLAEHRMRPPIPLKTYTCFLAERGGTVRRSFRAPALDDGDFGVLGESLLRRSWTRTGTVGSAAAHAFPIVDAVDFATGWLTDHRAERIRMVDR